MKIAEAKNLVRGSLSNKKARPVEVLAEVIEKLRPEDLKVFGAWVDRYPNRQARLYPPPRIRKYEGLWSGAYLTTIDLPSLLRWSARNLSNQREIIGSFVHSLK